MTDKYQFNRQFRLKILALMLDNFWMAKYGADLVTPEYFEQEDEELIAHAIIEYRRRYHRSPTDPDDLIVLAGNGNVDFIYELYNNKWDLSLASDLVIQFAREQAAKIAVLDSVDDINKGDLQTPIDRMKGALEVGQSLLSSGIDPIADVDKWLYTYWEDKIRTGWWHIDRILEGGLKSGELGIVLAPQNRGKSMSLINIGYGAASIGSGVNVVHFVHEMSKEQTARRYAARMTFRFPKRDDNLEEYEEELLDAARMLLPGKIRIIGGSAKMSIMELDGHMERLIAEGFEPGLILDDYPDLLDPPRHYKERRFELSATYEYLRALGGRYGCPVWGASQSGRQSHSKEIITMQDIAEDIGKTSIADVIVSLCQTYEEEQIGLCRLFMAKVRDGSKHETIAAKFYGMQQAIVTTGIVRHKEQDV